MTDGPWGHAIALRLTKRLPRPSNRLPAQPWAIELANGSRCTVATGSTVLIGGKPLYYWCRPGLGAWVRAHPHGAQVIAGYAATSKATRLRHVAVARIWTSARIPRH